MVNFALGVTASIFAWFAVNHLMRPKVKIAKFISKTPANSSLEGSEFDIYRIKIANARRWRHVVNLEVSVRLTVRGYDLSRPEGLTNLVIDTTPARMLYMRNSWLIRFRSEPYSHSDARAGREVKDDASTLEEWLSTGDDTWVTVWLSYVDGYSGVQRVDRRVYYRQSIKPVRFANGRTVALSRSVENGQGPKANN